MTTTTRKTAAAKTDKAAEPQAPAQAPDPGNLPMALAAFQAEMPVVPKAHTARIPGRDGGPGYSYQYADLADVTAAAMPLLTKHGLSFVCIPARTESGGYELRGTLLHVSGETLEGALPIAGRQAQEIGSSLTYNRRYLLGCMTGLVTDEDDDGAHAQAAQKRLQEQQPETQAPPLTPAQQRLNDHLAPLNAEQKEWVRSWWSNANVPALRNLTDDEVWGVYLALHGGGMDFPGIEYPPAETDDGADHGAQGPQDPSEAR